LSPVSDTASINDILSWVDIGPGSIWNPSRGPSYEFYLESLTCRPLYCSSTCDALAISFHFTASELRNCANSAGVMVAGSTPTEASLRARRAREDRPNPEVSRPRRRWRLSAFKFSGGATARFSRTNRHMAGSFMEIGRLADRYLGSGRCWSRGFTVLSLYGALSRPWSPFASLPPDVDVPLPLGLSRLLPVVVSELDWPSLKQGHLEQPHDRSVRRFVLTPRHQRSMGTAVAADPGWRLR
jgi:hypothetical protein